MDPKLIRALADGGVPFACALLVTIAAYRPKLDSPAAAKHRSQLVLLRVLGPIIMGYGAIMFTVNLWLR
jgi:hypothetical protein